MSEQYYPVERRALPVQGQYSMPSGIDRDDELTVTQFMLSPSVPPRERRYFEQFMVMFDHIMALGNIERRDIFLSLLAFDEICLLLEIGLYDEARKLMGRELMKMQLSRSVGALQLLFGQQGIQRTESIQRVLRQKGKKGLSGKLGAMFKGRDKSGEVIAEDVY